MATTVAEDLSYGLVNLGLEEGEIRRRIGRIAARFGLGDLLDRPVHMLSLGQKKQLSLADVMVLEPELLLLDEPTAFLSPGHCRDLRARLDHIHAAGTTIVVATHDLESLHGWADWLLVMDAGTLVLEGIPPTLALLQRWRWLADAGVHPLTALEGLEQGPQPADQLTLNLTGDRRNG